jgi:hypothetical protein
MYIYLIDYNYNNWFYIGKTKNSLEKRYKGHKGGLKSSNTLNHKVWNKSISEGNTPQIFLLEQTNEFIVDELEIWWIEYLKSIGMKLTNLTNGGEGVKGLIFTEQHKFNLSVSRTGKGIGPNLKLSEILKGVSKPKPEGFGIGRKHSVETIQKIKNSNKGKHSNNNRTRKINQIDKNTNIILNTFNSITEAAIFINPNKFKSIRSSIESAVNPNNLKQTSSCGYKWEYA